MIVSISELAHGFSRHPARLHTGELLAFAVWRVHDEHTTGSIKAAQRTCSVIINPPPYVNGNAMKRTMLYYFGTLALALPGGNRDGGNNAVPMD
jgi:hypothetical protein